MTERTKPNGGLQLAIDYLPLILFFGAYKLFGIFAGTAVFMVSVVIALILSKTLLGRVSPMLWLSAILVVGFGALTLWFRDPRFIQLKPTLIYGGLGLLLLIGVATGRSFIRTVLESGLDGVSDRGWMLLSRNWGLFFLAMAALNEAMWRNLDFDLWLTLKVWAVIPLTLIFGALNVPMLIRHGLALDDKPA